MFNYIYNGETHTDTTLDYMQGLGLDQEVIDSILTQKECEMVQWKTLRADAFQREADPLFFEWRDDKSKESEKVWRDKKAEIRVRFPKPAA